MRVEVATLDDVPRLVALGVAMHAESDYRDQTYDEGKVRALMEYLIGGGGAVFVLRNSEGLIVGGMAGGIAPNWFNDEPQGFEYALFVEREARHGLAALRLITAFTIWCQKRGAKRLRVGITTGVHPESTARLYEAAGFERTGIFLTKEF